MTGLHVQFVDLFVHGSELYSRIGIFQSSCVMEIAHDDHVDDAVLQISGTGHWFLEGWIGDHSLWSSSWTRDRR